MPPKKDSDGRGEVIIYDDNGTWLRFIDPVETVVAYSLEEAAPSLERVEHRVERDGLHAAGFVSYEASPAFDDALDAHVPSGFPLVWFGLYRGSRAFPPVVNGDAIPVGTCWKPDMSRTAYDSAFDRIKSYMENGHTYQVNFTFRLRSPLKGRPLDFFASATSEIPYPYSSYVDTGDYALCSFSPELFFRLGGNSITCKPMKGTAPRGTTTDEDRKSAMNLANSEKDRAENIMIVDMIRNDLGRIAVTGSVFVQSLWEVEKYPAVWQMTSTVNAETTATIIDIFRALFPCASVTGAPKPRTMRIIRELEPHPRHVYTGSIGYILPHRHARFNVAIRTVLVDKARKRAEYGTGGGIVWDSRKDCEYGECLVKARVVTMPQPRFSLIETILWDAKDGYFLLDRHIRRLEKSAEYFGRPVDTDAVRSVLEAKKNNYTEKNRRVRVTVSLAGEVDFEDFPFSPEAVPGPVRLRIAEEPVDSSSLYLYHKTTFREVYDNARGSIPDCDDVILFNERGEITETTIANIVVEIDNALFTPPVGSGLLAGTYRAELLEKGIIRERVILRSELNKCGSIFLINSVRKKMPAILMEYDTGE
ncbi:MAG: aminodeoxychorismate synthase component I [Candidatus Latescibacteria bacterium]|nr:aminodeoxychorismate synthase component I [Candidatus Latescibacterota bacterium]